MFITQIIRNGDEKAFRELVESNQDNIYRTCYGILHDEMDADEITQEVFIEAFKSASNFKGESKISTWLYRIAINKSLNFLRAKKRRSFLQFIGLGPVVEVADDEVNFDIKSDRMREKKRMSEIKLAIDLLPVNQRTAFLLHHINDLSYKEISETMLLSVSSVESLIFRAKKNIQKKILKEYNKE
jgi:RNA polymerase sigma factor (sigma-70 family)